jgi:hypothetical protein
LLPPDLKPNFIHLNENTAIEPNSQANKIGENVTKIVLFVLNWRTMSDGGQSVSPTLIAVEISKLPFSGIEPTSFGFCKKVKAVGSHDSYEPYIWKAAIAEHVITQITEITIPNLIVPLNFIKIPTPQ